MDSPRVSLGPKILVTEGAKHVRDGTKSPERKPEQQGNRNKRHEAHEHPVHHGVDPEVPMLIVAGQFERVECGIVKPPRRRARYARRACRPGAPRHPRRRGASRSRARRRPRGRALPGGIPSQRARGRSAPAGPRCAPAGRRRGLSMERCWRSLPRPSPLYPVAGCREPPRRRRGRSPRCCQARRLEESRHARLLRRGCLTPWYPGRTSQGA